MRSHRTLVVFTAAVSIAVSIAVLVAPAPPARAAETPRRGGVLLAAIAADAPSLDPHQEERSPSRTRGAVLQHLAPDRS